MSLSSFSSKVYSRGLGCYLYFLAGIFVEFLGDFSSDLQKDFWVLKEVFSCAFL